MTSIEWLYGKMFAKKGIITNEEFEKVKEIHYKELMNSMQRGMELQEKENNRIGFRERNGLLSKQETFVSKGSDETKQFSMDEELCINHSIVIPKLELTQQENLFTEEQVRVIICKAREGYFDYDEARFEYTEDFLIESFKQLKKH